MKAKLCFLMFVLSVCMLAGCNKEEKQIGLLPASQEHFYYEGTEGAGTFAVDENGLLYTIKYISPKDIGSVIVEEETELSKTYQEIAVYDLEGNRLKSERVVVGEGSIAVTALKDEVLYCINGKSPWEYNKKMLFAVDTETWAVTTVASLFEFKSIYYMTILGDYVYMLGECTEERLSEEETKKLEQCVSL